MLACLPQPLFVPCPASLGAPPSQQQVPSHVGRVGGMVFMDEGSRLVTVGQDDGIITVWKVRNPCLVIISSFILLSPLSHS